MDELNCADCGRRIELGERRYPTSRGPTHEQCPITRSTPLEWDRKSQQMKLDDLIIGVTVDFENDLPEWVIGAANAGQLRGRIVGYLDMMRDGLIQFHTTT